MIYIHVDSTSDLGQELANRHKINIIPLYVLIGEKSYVDGKEINIFDLFESVKKTNQLPKTSATPVGDFIQAFSPPGEHIYLGISSQLSATVKNAQLAAAALSHGSTAYVIDSLSLSTGIGMLALRAAELRDQGLSAKQIITQIEALIPNIRASFVIETLDYLYKGGRCSAMQNIVGSLLHIRPIISVRPDGTLGVKDRVRGARGKALSAILDDFKQNISRVDTHFVFVTHTGCDQDAEQLKADILQLGITSDVIITYAGSVIASHCGPDTIGILYTII